MKTKSLVGLVTAVLLPVSLVATASPASAVALRAAPPKVTIAIAGDQATISQATMRPGVVEFSVGDTVIVPGPDGGPEQLAVVRTDQLDYVLQQFGAVFGDPTDPAAGAAAAQGMRNIRQASTWYGGGSPGTTFQVVLPAGNYYVLGVQTAAMGLVKPAPFTVSGERRKGQLHSTTGTIRAVSTKGGGNAFVTKGLGTMGNGWLKFANSAKEIHFLGMGGVKTGTKNGQIRKFFQGSAPTFFTKTQYAVDVISPGISIAVKGPFKPGRYLIDCFVPSETDGMPHALMGMWSLVDIG